MQHLIYGAGAVGATLAVALVDAGREVAVVARGAHAARLRRDGLELRQPGGRRIVRVPVLEPGARLGLAADDVVFVAVKSQDTPGVLGALARDSPDVTVVCAQNGVLNEERARERFSRVLGAMVWLPAVFLEPGVVTVHAEHPAGVLRLGRWPGGRAAVADELARAFAAGGFDAVAVNDVDRWKHGKLLTNLGNVLDAYAVDDDGVQALWRRAVAEAVTVLEAAGRRFLGADDLIEAMRGRVHNAAVDDRARPGGSTWQSVATGRPTEVDAINGYICRLGARVGVDTPVNDALVALDAEAPPPRSVPSATIEARIAQG